MAPYRRETSRTPHRQAEERYDGGYHYDQPSEGRHPVGGRHGFLPERATKAARDDLDESWGSTAHGRGRPDFGYQGYRPRLSMLADHFRGSLTHQSRGRREYDESYQMGGRRMGYDYDKDFSERIRREWSRIRGEARDWIGDRGYDRPW